MKPVGSILILFFIPFVLFSQEAVPPARQNNFTRVTGYEELSGYIQLLDNQCDLLDVEIIGNSVEGRNLYALKFSSSGFGNNNLKIRVMIFAQQHGNEQSGKEGALLLAEELCKPENRYLFDKIDLLLIPQVNPDGAEKNIRRNAHDMDLNRNHLILTEPETRALHQVFDRYLFEVSMDVHEYSPYGEDWKSYGYRKNSDVTVGTATNLNVSKEIRNLEANGYLPFIFKYLNDRHFSAFEYSPGGPPDSSYFRHSTFDINDGRQSLAIQNTFSFIQEGMNGTDDFAENLQHRAEGQCSGMRGLLEYVYQNKDYIMDLVAKEREKLITGNVDPMISIQSNHVTNGQHLELPLFSYFTGKDTIVEVTDFRPVVKSVYDVTRPAGYLIPVSHPELVEWVKRQALQTASFTKSKDYRIVSYFINKIDTIDFEGDPTVDPVIKASEYPGEISGNDYIYIPVNQLKGNMIILALEPKSILGLVTYKDFASLLIKKTIFPVLRVEKKTE